MSPSPNDRPPYGAAAIASFAVFFLYVLTLAPSTAFWDASEYIATAHILGIPHPPGNPLFVAVGKVWLTLLAPSGLSVAVRMNLFAAATSAAAGGFFFLVAHRITRTIVPKAWMALVGAGASTLLGATAYTVWNQSTVNEKVYTLSVLIIAAASWLAIRWLDRRHQPGSERLVLLAAYLFVLGSTSHLMSALPAPALVLMVLLAGAPFLLNRAFWVRLLPLLALGLSFNFFLPVRSAQDPVINEGQPVCESWGEAAQAVFTNGRGGCAALAANLAREQYLKPPLTQRMAPFGAQIQNWFQYFDWQWARGADPSEQLDTGRLPFSLLFLTLGVVGLLVVGRADRLAGIYLGVLLVTLTGGLVFYLNFKYGFSLSPEVTDLAAHEVRERDYFFVAGFMLWGVLAGLGLVWLWNVVAVQLDRSLAHVMAMPILLVAAVPLLFNWGWASRAGDHAAEDWAYDLLASVEPYAVLFTNGDNDTFPLWYLQEVEGFRRDVTVVVGQYLNTSWYPRQLQRLTEASSQRPFEDDTLEALYGATNAPTAPIIDLAPGGMDVVVAGVLSEDLVVPFPKLAVTYPEGMFLDRTQRLALAIIHDSIDERPIYFASTAGMMNDLGLTRWAVRQGLVAKLDLRLLDGEQPEGYVQGSENLGSAWYDYERSLRLYEDMYRFRGLLAREIWFDRATLNIPWHFYAMALQLADVGALRGMSGERIAELQTDAAGFLITAQGGTKGSPTPFDGL